MPDSLSARNNPACQKPFPIKSHLPTGFEKDKHQKLLNVMNHITAAHNAFINLKRSDYPHIPDVVWQRIRDAIEQASAKWEIVCIWDPKEQPAPIIYNLATHEWVDGKLIEKK